jgi:hypothetical protein
MAFVSDVRFICFSIIILGLYVGHISLVPLYEENERLQQLLSEKRADKRNLRI